MDLNVDIGEGFPYDEQLLEFATSANVCCGEHAGSWELTLETIEMCKIKGVRIGMHPGFPDRASMGRAIPSDFADTYLTWLHSLQKQRQGFLTACRPAYVKPHGAWYNAVCAGAHAADGDTYALSLRALLLVCGPERLPRMLLAGCLATRLQRFVSSALHGEEATEWVVITEGFADRAYTPAGALVPRTEPGAVLEDPEQIKAQVLRLAPEVDSICIHGDTPGCLEFADLVRKTLEDAGYEVAA